MKLCFKILALVSFLITTYVFADTSDATYTVNVPEACKNVASACKKAGYDGAGFWFDCMKPLLLGQTVKNATVDANDAKACKAFKIEMLKKELQEFEQSPK